MKIIPVMMRITATAATGTPTTSPSDGESPLAGSNTMHVYIDIIHKANDWFLHIICSSQMPTSVQIIHIKPDDLLHYCSITAQLYIGAM